MGSELKREVEEVFADLTRSDKKLLEECTAICQTYNMSAEALLYKWEALNFRTSTVHSELSQFTMDSIAALKAQIPRDLARDNAKKSRSRVAPKTAPVTNTAQVNRARIPTNMFKNANPSTKPVGGLQVKVEENTSVLGLSTPSNLVYRGPDMDVSSRRHRSYRYMYEKTLEKSEALDERIEELSELVREHYKISDLGDPSSVTQDEDITVIGRIVHNTDAPSSSKLTDDTILLESSRMVASGARVPLRFDPGVTLRGSAQRVTSMSFFPGMIVALRGRNGGGGWFQVTEILLVPPLRAAPLPRGLPGLKVDPETSDKPFSVFIASGPYTSDIDLLYKPWRALLKAMVEQKPSIILLMGPFIDVQHPKIRSGDTDMLPSELLRSLVIEPLCAFLDSCPGAMAVLIPSVRDVVSRQAVYPQGELLPELTDLDRRIHLLPNPASFSINGVTFAATSVDVIYHLRKEEISKRVKVIDPALSSADDAGNDVMADACRQLLHQRSFYPVFPVPLDVSHEVNLSVTHSDGLRLPGGNDNNAPDVLVLPGRLKHFCKTVDSTLALNPSFLSKGTYAKVDVVAASSATNLNERITAEIAKLTS